MTREDFKISNQARVYRIMSDRRAVQGPWSVDHHWAEIRAIVHGLVGHGGVLETTVSQSCDDVFLIL